MCALAGEQPAGEASGHTPGRLWWQQSGGGGEQKAWERNRRLVGRLREQSSDQGSVIMSIVRMRMGEVRALGRKCEETQAGEVGMGHLLLAALDRATGESVCSRTLQTWRLVGSATLLSGLLFFTIFSWVGMLIP